MDDEGAARHFSIKQHAQKMGGRPKMVTHSWRSTQTSFAGHCQAGGVGVLHVLLYFFIAFRFSFHPAKASRVGKNFLKRHPGSEWFLFYRPSYSHFLVYYGLPDLLDPSQAQQILVYSTNPSNFQPQLCAVRNRAETVPILRAEL